jgi:hypothetical protein
MNWAISGESRIEASSTSRRRDTVLEAMEVRAPWFRPSDVGASRGLFIGCSGNY